MVSSNVAGHQSATLLRNTKKPLEVKTMKVLSILQGIREFINKRLAFVCAWFGLAMIVFIMMYTVSSVFSRYVLGKPILGDIEIPEILLPVVAAFIYTYGSAQKKHVKAEILSAKFSERGRTLLEGIFYFVASALYGIVTWQSVVHGLYSIKIHLATDVLYVPVGPIELVFCFAMAVFSLHLFLEGVFAFKAFAELPSARHQEQPQQG